MSETVIQSAPSDVFATVFGDGWGALDRWTGGRRFGYVPALAPTDIVDAGNAFELDIELPGFSKEQIDIRVTGNVVQIKAAAALASPAAPEKSYLHRERFGEGLARTVELPEAVSSESVAAKLLDGILHLTLPKAHPVVEQKIAIA